MAKTKCAHHWMIRPKAGRYRGKCKYCGRRRWFDPERFTDDDFARPATRSVYYLKPSGFPSPKEAVRY